MRPVTKVIAGGLGLVGLLLGPTIAWAAFTTQATATVTAGTATIAAPASATVTVTCPTGQSKVGTANVTTFTTVTGASSYDVTVSSPRAADVTTTLQRPGPATIQVNQFPNKGTWVVSIVARAGTWTSATAWSQTFTC